jgi:hypothetical protein
MQRGTWFFTGKLYYVLPTQKTAESCENPKTPFVATSRDRHSRRSAFLQRLADIERIATDQLNSSLDGLELPDRSSACIITSVLTGRASFFGCRESLSLFVLFSLSAYSSGFRFFLGR